LQEPVLLRKIPWGPNLFRPDSTIEDLQ